MHYDVIVIGSGFGGSVSALRLSEKGYSVGVLEAGARFSDADFARSSWDLRRFLFKPELGCYGIQRIDLLKDSLILSGAGVGGGSLVYANTLYEPLDAFYQDPQWRDITDWKTELAPYYDQATRMLGVVTNHVNTPSDDVMRRVAAEMGVEHTLKPTRVGVLFGEGRDEAGEEGTHVSDPFFGGAGPDRSTCRNCGACMTGCRYNAKNTLVKNYLYLAEKLGAQIHPLTTVTRVRPRPEGGYEVTARDTTTKAARRAAQQAHRAMRRRSSGADPGVIPGDLDSETGPGRHTFTADQVIFSAAALGTQRLLHRLKAQGHLPQLSDRLGHLARTNSESLLGAIAPTHHDDPAKNFSYGVAITSSFHPDEDTTIEPVRYGAGSTAMLLLQTVLTSGETAGPRWRLWAREMWAQRAHLPKMYDVRRNADRTVIALVMQTLDNSITTYLKRNPVTRTWRMTTKQGHGAPNPTWIPIAHDVIRAMARAINGIPAGTIGEPFNAPMTAHFIGGCVIGESAERGVIDPWQRVFGHPGLHVADGSAISANLGVNPSLTITAQAERAMAYWPNKGDVDPRPPLGSPYRQVAPVPPNRPAVPAEAFGALRLPL